MPKTKTGPINTPKNISPVLLFLRFKFPEFDQRDKKFTTGFPIKIQTGSENSAHAVIFKSAKEFSTWVNERTGCDTYCAGQRIVWRKIPAQAEAFLSKFNFFHTRHDLEKTEEDFLSEKQLRSVSSSVA